MNLDEKVAVLTAIQKRAKEMLDELRPELNSEALRAYEEDGVSKRAVRVAGEKVADLIVPMSKEDFEIDDPEAFKAFAQDYGLGAYVKAIDPARMGDAVAYLASEHPEVLVEEWRYRDWKPAMTPCGEGATYLDSGMPVPGVRRVKPKPKAPTLRGLKWEAVASAVGALPGGVSGLLGGAE